VSFPPPPLRSIWRSFRGRYSHGGLCIPHGESLRTGFGSDLGWGCRTNSRTPCTRRPRSAPCHAAWGRWHEVGMQQQPTRSRTHTARCYAPAPVVWTTASEEHTSGHGARYLRLWPCRQDSRQVLRWHIRTCTICGCCWGGRTSGDATARAWRWGVNFPSLMRGTTCIENGQRACTR